MNDVYTTDCLCAGTPDVDSDNDGFCDAIDSCPGGDDNIDTDGDDTPDFCDDCSTGGMPCDDGDPCTIGSTYDFVNCDCVGGILLDADNDGVCDANDICPNFDDNLIGTTCDDGDACTTGETYDANCGCSGGIVEDSDNDGICDALDECPNDSSNSCNSVQTCASTGTNTTYEYIDAVQIENLINRSGNNSGYSNFTALSANVIGGETYNVTLTPGFEIQPYIEHWAIAVDLDGNGNFNGAEEVLLLSLIHI